jgi:GT2 family glycosyltransferase
VGAVKPAGPAPIALPTSDDPHASIVIVATGASVLLEHCLERLAATATRTIPFETIVVLNSAEDGRAARLRARVPGARIEHSSVNLGLAGALNRGRMLARGEFLVLLHDDVEVEPGWLEALVTACQSDPRIGAVGSLVLNFDGGVQAAGWELLPDGRTRPPWGAGEPPDAITVGAGAARPVDYCPSCSLLVRAASWDEVGGADERLFPAYYVDVDLCLALRAHGKLVLCEPRSMVHHHRGASLRPDLSRFIAERNRTQMLEKWGARISSHVPGSGSADEMGPSGSDVPRPTREPDAERQERAHLERAASAANDYAAELDTRLGQGDAELARIHAELARIHGEYALLHEAHVASERERASQGAELERLRERERVITVQLADLGWLREREATLRLIEAGGWWRLRGRLLPLLRLAGRVRRRSAVQ